MTIKELREMLGSLPDEATVVVDIGFSNTREILSVRVTSVTELSQNAGSTKHTVSLLIKAPTSDAVIWNDR